MTAKEIDLQRPLLAQAADPVGGHRHIPAVAQTQQQIAVGSCRRRQRQQLLAEQRIGTRQQIFDPPVLDDRPVADLRHRIRRRAHRVHFMGNQDDRQLVLITQPLEQSQHRGRGLRIEAGGGFIRQQNGRAQRQRAGNADPLALAA